MLRASYTKERLACYPSTASGYKDRMPTPLSLYGFLAWLVGGFAFGLGFALANGLIAVLKGSRV